MGWEQQQEAEMELRRCGAKFRQTKRKKYLNSIYKLVTKWGFSEIEQICALGTTYSDYLAYKTAAATRPSGNPSPGSRRSSSVG